MRTSARLLSVAAAAATCLTLWAPAADAAERTVVDKSKDVSWGRVDSPGGYVYSDTPEGDVLRTTFRHGPHNVVVTSKFRGLSRTGGYHGFYLRLQTGRKLYREVTVEAEPGRWRGVHSVMRRDGTQARCAVTHTIDYDANTVRVVVPRACLGKPRLVRGTAADAWTQPDTEDPSQSDYVYLDNPHNTDVEANTWTPWIRRG